MLITVLFFCFFRMGLATGVLERRVVIAWADRMILGELYVRLASFLGRFQEYQALVSEIVS
jgi:hypothetical protein